MDKLSRQKALLLLFTGSVFGLAGFFFAAFAGLKVRTTHNIFGQKYPSGNAYFPLTVSEMVHDSSTPQGKAFLGFELLAGLMILMSWYPYSLSNAYIGDRHTLLTTIDGSTRTDLHGDSKRGVGQCIPSWTTLRQFLPGVGLAVVALVSTTPIYEKTDANISFITCQIHIIGATALFGGYILVEMQALFYAEPKGQVKMKRNEKLVRTIFIIFTAIGAFLTIALQQTYGTALIPVCCADQYSKINLTSMMAVVNDTQKSYQLNSNYSSVKDLKLITQGFIARSAAESIYTAKSMYQIDTASGTSRTLKLVSFWAEVMAGVFGLGSHLVIWYYAPERGLVLGDYNQFTGLGRKEQSESEEESE